MIYPNTIIMGPSGSGKSSSIRGLDPSKTAILNTERKALPFRKSMQYKFNINVHKYKSKKHTEFVSTLKKAIENPNIENIVIESLTSLFEMIQKYAEGIATGYDQWKVYNDEIGKVFEMTKEAENKWIFFIAIDQVIESSEGIQERYVAVQGNNWKKKIEKEAVNVFFTTTREGDNGELEYIFKTNKTVGFENVSCKSPMDMFPAEISNDLGLAINYMKEYYGLNEEDSLNDKKEKEND